MRDGDRFDIRPAQGDEVGGRRPSRMPVERDAWEGAPGRGGDGRAWNADTRASMPTSGRRMGAEGIPEANPARRGKPSARRGAPETRPGDDCAPGPSAVRARTEVPASRLAVPPRVAVVAALAALLAVLAVVLAVRSCGSSDVEPDPAPVQNDPAATSLIPLSLRDASAYGLGEDGVLTVVLDPGHGGDDPGAVDEALQLCEHDICWKIAGYCADYLRQYEGVEVVYTRMQPANPSLAERGETAGAVHGDILVSLHINSIDDMSQRGAYTYYPNETSLYRYDETVPHSKAVAEAALANLVALGLYNNGSWEYTINVIENPDLSRYAYPNEPSGITDYLGIIRNSRLNGVGAVLVEHAFITNPEEAVLLQDESFLKALGEADAKAVLSTFGFPLT